MLKNREEVLQNDKQTGLTDSKWRLMVSFKILIQWYFYYLCNLPFLLLQVWITKGTTIWSWEGGGGGAGKFCRDRLFIFITGSARKFISG